MSTLRVTEWLWWLEIIKKRPKTVLYFRSARRGLGAGEARGTGAAGGRH